MANIQWNRHINKLCEHQGGHRYDDMLIGCIAAFHQKGRSSEKQGDVPVDVEIGGQALLTLSL